MTERDWLRLASRVIGVWMLAIGIPGVVLALSMSEQPGFTSQIFHAIAQCVVGYVLLGQTHLVVDFAYAKRGGERESDEGTTADSDSVEPRGDA